MRLKRLLQLVGTLALASLTCWQAAAADTPRPPGPQLVVVISVDQFGANLFEAWRGRFTGGLRRLANEGIVFSNGYQTHATTETCPGHSTILTGKHPSKTGIVSNDWYDSKLGRDVYCLESSSNKLAHDPAAPGRGPENLKATTLGEWLKAASPASKVVGIAGKDRAAINLTGHGADGAFWLAEGFGFTTYVAPGQDATERLAPLAALNGRTQESWRTNPPVWTYANAQCRALEATYTTNGQTWRSQLPPTTWRAAAGAENVKREFKASPFSDELTLDGARELIRHYKLGRRGVVDLLAIGLSATDYIGHRYGSQGPEMCDHLGRIDAMLGAFLSELTAVDPNVLVVLTADHGGSDFPERLQAGGYPAATRLDYKAWLAAANAAVRARLRLGYDPLVATRDDYHIDQLYVVNAAGKAPAEALRSRIVAATLGWLGTRPEVAQGFALSEILASQRPAALEPPDERSLRERVADSVHAGRSGDILVQFKPYTTLAPARPGSTMAGHGSPWNYDRRVPILFWSPRLTPAERPLPIETVDIAPTLANVLGLPAPADVDGRCIDLNTSTAPCAARLGGKLAGSAKGAAETRQPQR